MHSFVKKLYARSIKFASYRQVAFPVKPIQITVKLLPQLHQITLWHMLPLAIGLHAGFAFIPAASFDTKDSQKKAELPVPLTGIPLALPVPLKVAAPPTVKPPVQLAAKPQPPVQRQVVQPAVKPVIQETKVVPQTEKPVDNPRNPSADQPQTTDSKSSSQASNSNPEEKTPDQTQLPQNPLTHNHLGGMSLEETKEAYARLGYDFITEPVIQASDFLVYKLLHHETQKPHYNHFVIEPQGVERLEFSPDLFTKKEVVLAKIEEKRAQQ
ncbi:hypothetical protein ACN4EG_23730 [Alkalinema pantanalense CENA528]|uniref:hypothetical protein n=1 Tax=Alkalinema pantanalense TaxID=1620705 RepID=UPI003D6EF01F